MEEIWAALPQEEAPPVTPYPYQPDEVIGGDSVQAIQSRLLAKKPSPSFDEIGSMLKIASKWK